MDRCALFVDAGYLLADGAMAVHGARLRETVSWDFDGLLQLLGNIARERTGKPLLRCYWYEATVEGRRAPEHEALADLPGLKLRLGRIRPGRREGVGTEIHRDLLTLARNHAVADAIVVSGDEDLAQVIIDAQDLGVRVAVVHVAVDGNWTISRTLRQECDDLIEISSGHLRPYVTLQAGADSSSIPQANGHGSNSGSSIAPLHASGPYSAPPPSSPTTNQYPQSQPSTPTVSAPPSAQSSYSAPSYSAPSNSMPSNSTPSNSTPSYSTPSYSTPSYSTPSYSGPSFSPPSFSSPLPVPSPSPSPSPLPAPPSASSNSTGNPGSSNAGPGGPFQHPLLGGSAVPSQAAPTSSAPMSSPFPPSTPSYLLPSANPPISPSAGPQHGSYTGSQSLAPASAQQAGASLSDAVKAAHQEGQDFGESVAKDAPALWLEAVLARKPRMPSDLEARLLQGSTLPIDFLLHDEVRHALRRGFWDALERSRR